MREVTGPPTAPAVSAERQELHEAGFRRCKCLPGGDREAEEFQHEYSGMCWVFFASTPAVRIPWPHVTRITFHQVPW